MKAVRIGNDVRNILIPVTRFAEPFVDWDSLVDLKVHAVERNRRKYFVTPTTVYKEDGQLRLYFSAEDLQLGIYDILITFSIADPINQDGQQPKIIDIQKAFSIVEHTSQEVDSQDQFAVALDFAKDGLSYYQIWSQYFEGTQEDMIAWHQKPAIDAAATAAALELFIEEAENLRAGAEEVRERNEGLRSQAEQSRETAEGSRNDAEVIRERDEELRNQAEQSRETAEGSRNDAEVIRERDEGLRSQAEQSRETAEGFRNDAEVIRERDEGLRSQAEQSRETAEGSRNDAEVIRERDEGLRSQAEQSRETAEGDRQTNTTKAIRDAEFATQDANDAAVAADILARDYNARVLAIEEKLPLKADLLNGKIVVTQLPNELVDTTLYLTNVAHRKRRIKDGYK